MSFETEIKILMIKVDLIGSFESNYFEIEKKNINFGSEHPFYPCKWKISIYKRW